MWVPAGGVVWPLMLDVIVSSYVFGSGVGVGYDATSVWAFYIRDSNLQ